MYAELLSVGVGHDQQHDSRSGFLGECLEVNGLRLRADGGRLVGGKQRNSGNENSEHPFHARQDREEETLRQAQSDKLLIPDYPAFHRNVATTESDFVPAC